MSELWAAFWFFLPAGVANMSPVLAAHLPLLKKWNTPIDFGLRYKGSRLLGDNKTWRGVAFGAFSGAVIGLLQYRVITSSPETTSFIIATTAAMGFGALCGDAVASFFKRRARIKPGDSWFPVDQLDYIIGGILFALLFVPLTLAEIVRITAIYFVLHLVVVFIFYKLGVKSKPI